MMTLITGRNLAFSRFSQVGVNFSLRGAHLSGVDLRQTKALTQEQVDSAKEGDSATQLPENLHKPEAGRSSVTAHLEFRAARHNFETQICRHELGLLSAQRRKAWFENPGIDLTPGLNGVLGNASNAWTGGAHAAAPSTSQSQAQTKVASQPITVQPSQRLITMLSSTALCLRRSATKIGRGYSTRRSSGPIVNEYLSRQ